MMKAIFAALLGFVVVAASASQAEAQFFRARGTNVVSVNSGNGNVVVQNQRRGLLGLRNNTRVFVNNNHGARNANVLVARNHGFRNNNAVFVRANNRGLRNNVVAVNVNGHGLNRVNNFNRANVFGTRTVVANNGNVFEVDQFGNSRFRGSAFRGFGNNGLRINAGFNTGFNTGFHGNAVNSFSFGHSGLNNAAVFSGFGSCH